MAKREKAAPKSSLNSILQSADDTALPLNQSRGEARVDSRIIAAHLDVQHESVARALINYGPDFATLGVFRSEIGKPNAGPLGGRPERFWLLNEDQCYLLLTYSRNTDQVRALKLKLVHAFREARERQAIADTQYLPGYHALHDEVMALAQIASEHGSLAGEEVFHCNANKLVNKAAGISAGMRAKLTDGERLMVTNLQVVLRNALRAAIDAGADHREAYQRAKDAALDFAQAAGRYLGGA
ncbi:Rha family transcriptional regulator [Caballeronia grimmiae]|uniref:Rha family transcriptional regulator n=1 Tax=Caballeronia grimmiae TaxID=1071679 RepID=UPI0038BBF66F